MLYGFDRILEVAIHEFVKSNGASSTNPYHNAQHAFRVATCISSSFLPKIARQNVMLAGLFHDWRHPGGFGVATTDQENVERAAQKVLTLGAPYDTWNLEYVADLIRATVFPMSPEKMQKLDENMRILRDADVWHAAFLNEQD